MPGQFRGVATASSISCSSFLNSISIKSLTVAFIIQCDYTPISMFLMQCLDYPPRGLAQWLAEILHAVCQRRRRIQTDETLVEEKHVRTITLKRQLFAKEITRGN
jgi:hypothetical protein